MAAKADSACDALVAQNNSPGTGTPDSLVASYPSTAGQMTTWDRQMPAHLGSSQFSTLPSSELVSVCYISGEFLFPGGGRVPPVEHEAVVVIPTHGSPMLDFAGPLAATYPPPSPPGPSS